MLQKTQLSLCVSCLVSYCVFLHSGNLHSQSVQSDFPFSRQKHDLKTTFSVLYECSPNISLFKLMSVTLRETPVPRACASFLLAHRVSECSSHSPAHQRVCKPCAASLCGDFCHWTTVSDCRTDALCGLCLSSSLSIMSRLRGSFGLTLSHSVSSCSLMDEWQRQEVKELWVSPCCDAVVTNPCFPLDFS